jgi:hypothetical protein
MRTPSFLSSHLREFLRSQKIATLPEMKHALGTTGDITVFRKLKELSYRSSYSHRGRYYTLDEIPQFDPQGLWSFHQVWFSRWGNLVTTLETLVSAAPQGYFAGELQRLLHVEVKDALLQLVQQRRAARQQVSGLFLYCSPDAAVRRRQLLARQALSEIPGSASAEVSPEELKASLVLFSSLLDERQRRLYAGLESLKLGRGGDQRLAELLQLTRHRGPRTQATPGAGSGVGSGTQTRGRPQARGKKTPHVISEIEKLLEHDTAGDPMSSLRWTHKTTAKIAEQLHRLGIRVGARTVARLLDNCISRSA